MDDFIWQILLISPIVFLAGFFFFLFRLLFLFKTTDKIS